MPDKNKAAPNYRTLLARDYVIFGDENGDYPQTYHDVVDKFGLDPKTVLRYYSGWIDEKYELCKQKALLMPKEKIEQRNDDFHRDIEFIRDQMDDLQAEIKELRKIEDFAEGYPEARKLIIEYQKQWQSLKKQWDELTGASSDMRTIEKLSQHKAIHKLKGQLKEEDPALPAPTEPKQAKGREVGKEFDV